MARLKLKDLALESVISVQDYPGPDYPGRFFKMGDNLPGHPAGTTALLTVGDPYHNTEKVVAGQTLAQYASSVASLPSLSKLMKASRLAPYVPTHQELGLKFSRRDTEQHYLGGATLGNSNPAFPCKVAWDTYKRPHPYQKYSDGLVFSISDINPGVTFDTRLKTGAYLQVILSEAFLDARIGSPAITSAVIPPKQSVARMPAFVVFVIDSNAIVEPYGEEFIYVPNVAPNAPTGLVASTSPIYYDTSVSVTWTGAGDPDDNLAGYKLEMSVNGGVYTTAYQGVKTYANVQMQQSYTSVKFRVSAYDTLGIYSAYAETERLDVLSNRPPTVPESITVPASISSVMSNVIGWGASSDADGDAINYQLERQANGGAWVGIYEGSVLSYTDSNVLPSYTRVRYRVRALDVKNAASEYRTSSERGVTHNTPPAIVVESEDLGTKTDPFAYQFFVTDNENDVVSVSITLDGKPHLSHPSVTLGQSYDCVNLDSSAWIKLRQGAHTAVITATDARGGVTTQSLTFRKLEQYTRMQSLNPTGVDKRPEMIIAQAVYSLAAGAVVRFWVCNNALDTNPTWEEITTKINTSSKHFFGNNVKTATKWAVGIKAELYDETGRGESYLTEISGNWK